MPQVLLLSLGKQQATLERAPDRSPVATLQAVMGRVTGGFRAGMQSCASRFAIDDYANLRAGLQAALAEVGVTASADRFRLRVRLGLTHAKVGLLDLKGARPSPDELAAVTGGWVSHRLHLDPSTQEVRWRVVNGGEALLVTAVPTQLLTQLKAFAAERRIRFDSCIPAVIDCLDARLRETRKYRGQRSCTLLWTELGSGEVRHPAVQLFRISNQRLTATWRGWVPQDSQTDSDSALSFALRRFQAVHATGPGEDPIWRVQWPAQAGAGQEIDAHA